MRCPVLCCDVTVRSGLQYQGVSVSLSTGGDMVYVVVYVSEHDCYEVKVNFRT